MKKPTLVHPGLQYAHKKLNFACRIFFWKMFVGVQKLICGWKKNKKFWGNFKITWNQKNAIKKLLVR